MEDDAKAALFGRYLLSLTPTEKSFSGSRVKVISSFIDSGEEFSKSGYAEYVKTNGMDLTQEDKRKLRDFLSFSGVRHLGRRRRKEGKVVEKIAVITEGNKKRISAFIDWAREKRDYSESSIKQKVNVMVKFFRYFNDFSLSNCRDFIATMEHEGINAKTLNIYMCVLKEYGEYVKKPVALKKVSIPRSLSVENVPTEKEYKNFLQWLSDNEKWQMYWVVRFLGCTGMRRSELDQLTWEDVLSGSFFPLCKGKKRRMIYFPKAVVAELKAWLKDHPKPTSEKIITSRRTGRPISSRSLDQSLKNAAQKARFPKEKAHAHAFRHFFAKQFLARTKDVIQLAELLGHESVDTTRLYLQKSKAEQARDVNKYITW